MVKAIAFSRNEGIQGMSSQAVFGTIFVARDIEHITEALLQLWFPTYLKEIEDQHGITVGTVLAPNPKNYTRRNEYSDLPGEELPKVVIISPGLIGTPIMGGNGQFRAIWRLGIAVATAAETEELAKFYCDVYGAAVREIMLKHGGGALSARVNWIDEQYSGIPLGNNLQRYRAAALWFGIDVENVATKRGGPTVPDQDPYTYHTANTVVVTKIKEPVDG